MTQKQVVIAGLSFLALVGLSCGGLVGYGMYEGLKSSQAEGLLDVQSRVSRLAGVPVQVTINRRFGHDEEKATLGLALGKSVTPDEELAIAKEAYQALKNPSHFSQVCVSQVTATGPMRMSVVHCHADSELQTP